MKNKNIKTKKLIKRIKVELDDLEIIKKSYIDSISSKTKKNIFLMSVIDNYNNQLKKVEDKINAYNFLLDDLSNMKETPLDMKPDNTGCVRINTDGCGSIGSITDNTGSITDLNHPNNSNWSYTNDDYH